MGWEECFRWWLRQGETTRTSGIFCNGGIHRTVRRLSGIRNDVGSTVNSAQYSAPSSYMVLR